MINEKKILSYISLAMKAGKISSGEFSVENSVKGGQSFLVIVSADASANTTKKFSDMTSFRNIPFIQLFDKETLGKAIGKEFRVSISVNDEGFSKAILSCYEMEVNN